MLADVFFDTAALIQPYVLGPPYLLNAPVFRNFNTNGTSLILIICCVFRKHSTARAVYKEMLVVALNMYMTIKKVWPHSDDLHT